MKRLLHEARLNQKTGILLLTCLYLLMSFYLYHKYGIKLVNDSPRYLGYAANIRSSGVYFDPLNFWYISYAFFIYLSQLFHQSHGIIIFNQYLLGYVALLAIFFTTRRLTNSVVISFLAGLIFICFPDNLNWHSYVLTESLYGSITCIVFYLLVRFAQDQGGGGISASLGLPCWSAFSPNQPLLRSSSPWLRPQYWLGS